jgi:hypothetical protein
MIHGAIALLAFMRILDHVSALCREVPIGYGIYSPGVIEYTEALARKDWPRFRDPFDIPSPRVEDGRIYLAKQGSIGMRISLVIQKSHLSICSRCRGE